MLTLLVDSRDAMLNDAVTNDSVDAILSMVPKCLHKYLTPHSRNHSGALTGRSPGTRCNWKIGSPCSLEMYNLCFSLIFSPLLSLHFSDLVFSLIFLFFSAAF